MTVDSASRWTSDALKVWGAVMTAPFGKGASAMPVFYAPSLSTFLYMGAIETSSHVTR